MFRCLLSTEPWLRDPAVVPIPFRQNVMDAYLSRADKKGNATDRPLKLGIFWTNDVLQPHPPVTRGLKMVAEAMRKAGHKVSSHHILLESSSEREWGRQLADVLQVVDWNPPSHRPAMETHVRNPKT